MWRPWATAQFAVPQIRPCIGVLNDYALYKSTHSLTYLLVYLLTAGSTSYECPTLLHLSARYGLEQLSARLVDLPDARLALDVRDRRGRRPEDVAAQRRELARRFRNFREMVRK